VAESAASDAPSAAVPGQVLLWEEEESFVIGLPRPNHEAVVQIERGLVGGVVAGDVLVLREYEAVRST
jgi:hypothetical protein